MGYFADLRQYVSFLEEKGKLYRFKDEVVKETEMAPLVLLQYRGLPEHQRKVFLFEKVVGVTGRRYNHTTLMASPPSREILAMGLNCSLEDLKERWLTACAHPLEPEILQSGPVHEVVIEGDELKKEGLEIIGAPVEAPGFSGSIRTSTQVVTKDPETG
ncbi:MAG: UbiD family decarboxylase, partial [Desulfobacterales bacterium]|nr:UbiD family decarboxylase [Desulfobacterales bacterium]